MKIEIRLIIMAAVVVVAIASGIVIVSSGAASAPVAIDTSGNIDDTIIRVQNALGTDRIASVKQDEGTLRVVIDKQSPAEFAVSKWYGKVLAREVVSESTSEGDGTAITAITEVDSSGVDVNGGPDRITGLLPTSPLAKGACKTIASSKKADAQVSVLEVREIDALKGGCLFVVTPTTDTASFVSDAAIHIGVLLGSIPDRAAHPLLVEVVDENGQIQLVLGSIPGVGGSAGQGLAWISPGSQSSAIVGTTPPLSASDH